MYNVLIHVFAAYKRHACVNMFAYVHIHIVSGIYLCIHSKIESMKVYMFAYKYSTTSAHASGHTCVHMHMRMHTSVATQAPQLAYTGTCVHTHAHIRTFVHRRSEKLKIPTELPVRFRQNRKMTSLKMRRPLLMRR